MVAPPVPIGQQDRPHLPATASVVAAVAGTVAVAFVAAAYTLLHVGHLLLYRCHRSCMLFSLLLKHSLLLLDYDI